MRTRSKISNGEVKCAPPATTMSKAKPEVKGSSKKQEKGGNFCGLVNTNMRTRSQKNLNIGPNQSQAVVVIKNSPIKTKANNNSANSAVINSKKIVEMEVLVGTKIRTRSQKKLDGTPDDPKEKVIAASKAKLQRVERDDPKVIAAPKAKPQQVNKERGKQMNKKAIATTSSKTFKVGDLCFAKVRGWKEWPGFVTSLGENFAWVKFFNSNQVGKCFFGSVFNLEESIKFLHRHDKSPLEKAKLEMVVSMRERIKEDKIDVKSSIIKEYLKILD